MGRKGRYSFEEWGEPKELDSLVTDTDPPLDLKGAS